jgi:hypothetical protein
MKESRGIDYKHRIRRKNRLFWQRCWGRALRSTIAPAEADGRAQGRIGSRSSPIEPQLWTGHAKLQLMQSFGPSGTNHIKPWCGSVNDKNITFTLLRKLVAFINKRLFLPHGMRGVVW